MRIEVAVLELSRPPRRFVAGEVARSCIVDGAPLLGREDYYLAMLLPRAGDFDLPE